MTHSYTILGIGLSENRLGHLNTLTVSTREPLILSGRSSNCKRNTKEGAVFRLQRAPHQIFGP